MSASKPYETDHAASNSQLQTALWVQGWRSGESTRLPLMWPGFDSQTQRHVWVEFVGSLLCTERFFSGYSGFCPPFKNQHLTWFALTVGFSLRCPQLVLQTTRHSNKVRFLSFPFISFFNDSFNINAIFSTKRPFSWIHCKSGCL